MAIVFPGQQDPYGIKAIGNPLIAALQRRTDQNRQQQQNIAQGGILNNVLSQINENSSASDMIKAIAQAQGQGLSQENAKPYLSALEHVGRERESRAARQQVETEKREAKLSQQQMPLRAALGSIRDMKALVPELGLTNLGLTPSGRASQQAYITYKNSVLGALSSIPVRNRNEYEDIRKTLSSPFSTQKEISSALDSAERIIQRKLGEDENAPQEMAKTSERNQNETVNIRKGGKGKAVPIPRSEWEALTDSQRQGFEQI